MWLVVYTDMEPFSDDLIEAPGMACRLLTADRVAERLGVRVSWVSKAARADRIPHVRVGRYRRFYWPDIEAWLVTQRRGKG